ILGLAQGYCGGRGGSMHLQWFEAGALGTNAIVGGGVPMALGNSWAQKHSPAERLVARPMAQTAAVSGAQPGRTSRGDDPPYPPEVARGGASPEADPGGTDLTV